MSGTFIALTFSVLSCSNLDEELYDQVTPEKFLTEQAQYISALGATYSGLGEFATGDVFSLQEVTTDEIVVPTRGQDWDDGGTWRRLHLHNYNYEDPTLNSAWNFGYRGINNCNRNIELFQNLVKQEIVKSDEAGTYISELKVLREFFTGN